MASSRAGSWMPRAAICRRTIVSRSGVKSCMQSHSAPTLTKPGSKPRDPAVRGVARGVIIPRMKDIAPRAQVPAPPSDLAPQPLDHATALPARFYADPAYVAVDRALIFDRGWQLIAHVCQLRNAGDHTV